MVIVTCIDSCIGRSFGIYSGGIVRHVYGQEMRRWHLQTHPLPFWFVSLAIVSQFSFRSQFSDTSRPTIPCYIRNQLETTLPPPNLSLIPRPSPLFCITSHQIYCWQKPNISLFPLVKLGKFTRLFLPFLIFGLPITIKRFHNKHCNNNNNNEKWFIYYIKYW